MNQELRIVEALKAYAWLKPYQRREVAAMFSTALAVMKDPDNDKAA
jgi:hypothetical protein